MSDHEKLFLVHQYFLFHIFILKSQLKEAIKIIQKALFDEELDAETELRILACKIRLRKYSKDESNNVLPSVKEMSVCLLEWFIYETEGIQNSSDEYQSFKGFKVCSDHCMNFGHEYSENNHILLITYHRKICRNLCQAVIYKESISSTLKFYPYNASIFNVFLDLYSKPRFLIINELQKLFKIEALHIFLLINHPNFREIGLKFLPKFLSEQKRQLRSDHFYLELWKIYIETSHGDFKENITKQAVKNHPWNKEFYMLLKMPEKWDLIADKELRVS